MKIDGVRFNANAGSEKKNRGPKRVAAGLVVALVAAGLTNAAAAPFGFDDVIRIAEDEAKRPFENPQGEVPDFLLKLSYDQWWNIRFRPDQALWRSDGLPFEVQFFLPGFYYNQIVAIYQVENGEAVPVPFSKQMFDYDGDKDISSKIPDNLGFAGFRVHYPINRPDYRDELAVFLGASYFRVVPQGLHFGLSARGLAVDTATDAGEEFTYFKTFWLVKPGPDAKEMTIYALLDNASLTGAYAFVLQPGVSTVMEIRLKLFTRKSVERLGIAPLTSMYFYSETTNVRPVDDFRPELHDSDGLLMVYPYGEFLWRQLVNWKQLFFNVFEMSKPGAFGLLQRDMDFNHYQDLEARYDERPSTWVEPRGDWGHGKVELVQIPTDSGKNGNIVAFWSPDLKPGDQNTYSYEYNLVWYDSRENPRHSLGSVTSTRTSAGETDKQRLFLVNFKGGYLDELPPQLPADSPLEADVSIGDKGEIIAQQLIRNEPDGSWRLVLTVQRKESPLQMIIPTTGEQPPIEMRAFLKQGGRALTETWSYAWH